MRQGVALSQSPRLLCDPLLCLQSSRKLGVQTRLLGLRQVRLGSPHQGQDLYPDLPQLPFGLSHQRHKHVSHPPTLAAEAAHDLRQVVLEVLLRKLPALDLAVPVEELERVDGLAVGGLRELPVRW